VFESLPKASIKDSVNPRQELGTGKVINKPLSSILKACHFFLFTSTFKKIFFNSKKEKFNLHLFKVLFA
jgi:hypothetical protein